MFSRSAKDNDQDRSDAASSSGKAVPNRDVQVVRFDPPRGIRAPFAGVLVDGKLGAREVSAMLIDLSLRGWFAIEQEGKDWALVSARTLPPRGDVASRSEELLMNALFRPGLTQTLGDAVPRQYVSLSSLKRRLQGHVDEVTMALGDEMVNAGLATRNPGARGIMSRRSWLSDDGQRAKAEAESFKHYLAKVEAKQLTNDQSDGFVGGYLAYAVAFELVGAWSKTMGESGVQTTTAAGQMLAEMHRNPMLVGMAAAASGGFSLDDLYVLAIGRNYGAKFPGGR